MQGQRGALAWTLVRMVFGGLLVVGHGLPKTRNVAGFAEGVAKLGFPLPMFFAWCAVLTEVVGGTLITLGLFTRPAAAFAAFTMVVATFRHRVDPFSVMEKALLFLTVFVALVLAGPGPWSLDAKVRRRA